MKSAPKALIINPFGIGDVLFTTPVIKALKDNIPGIAIDYWCNERVAVLLEDNPYIERVFALSKGDIKELSKISRWKSIKKATQLMINLKKARFDICFDFSLDHRYSLVAKIAGIKRRIGFNYKNRGRFLTDKIDINGYSEKHAVEYYLDLLRFVKIQPKYFALELNISSQERQKVKDLLVTYGISAGDLVVGVAPGAGRSWGKDAQLKHWPAESFAALIDKINKSYKIKVILLGDRSERNIADKILKTVATQVIDLVGKSDLKEFAALIDRVSIMVTNDGGPMHMAVALGKKTVSFFGPVDPKVYGPYPQDNDKHIVLSKQIECRPCYQNFSLEECSNNRKCLTEISVEEAFGAVSRLLSGENK